MEVTHIRKCEYAYKCILYNAGTEACFEFHEKCQYFINIREAEANEERDRRAVWTAEDSHLAEIVTKQALLNNER